MGEITVHTEKQVSKNALMSLYIGDKAQVIP